MCAPHVDIGVDRCRDRWWSVSLPLVVGWGVRICVYIHGVLVQSGRDAHASRPCGACVGIHVHMCPYMKGIWDTYIEKRADISMSALCGMWWLGIYGHT